MKAELVIVVPLVALFVGVFEHRVIATHGMGLMYAATNGVDLSCLSELRNLLKTLSADVTCPEGDDSNTQLLRAIARPDNLQLLLERVLEDEALLSQVADRSYKHVNHFDKIVLIGNDDPSGYRLTLHMWAPPYTSAQLDNELIHDHRFSFWSAVVAGVIDSENYSEESDGSPYRKYRYIPEQRHKSFLDFYEFRGDTQLLTLDRTRLETGESYSIVGPRIHQVILPRESVSCTLVLRGPRVRSYANVFNKEYPRDNTQFDNSMFSPVQLTQKLERLARLV